MRWSKLLCAVVRRVALSACLAGGPAGAVECYRIATAAGVGATGEIATMARAAFERSGFCVDMVRLPPKRIVEMALLGQIDGWAQAIEPDPAAKDFITVPTPFTELIGTLYWPSDRAEPRGRNDLIGVVMGQDWADREVARRHARIFAVRDNKQLLSMVQRRRLQGFMMPSVTYRHFLPSFPKIEGYASAEVTSLPVTITLRRQYGDLVPALDQAVRQLREQGLVERVLQAYVTAN